MMILLDNLNGNNSLLSSTLGLRSRTLIEGVGEVIEHVWLGEWILEHVGE